MRDIGTIMKIWAAVFVIWAGLMVILVLSSPSLAADNPDGYYIKNEQTLEQDVEGEGYVMVYQKVNTKSLQLKNYMHGSGSVDTATLLYSNQTSTGGYVQDKDTHVYGEYKTVYGGNIDFTEQNEMVYSPVAMVYGTGYYAENPVVYDSKLKERTEAKNYGGSNCKAKEEDDEAVSMTHQIEYASALVKDIGVDLKNQERWPPSGYYTAPEDRIKGSSSTSMNIEEVVTEGSVHIGQLLTKTSEGWKNPLIEIDENYVGTFKITKNMVISTSCSASSYRPDWLSCCLIGYDEMEEWDVLFDEEEFFNCTSCEHGGC